MVKLHEAKMKWKIINDVRGSKRSECWAFSFKNWSEKLANCEIWKHEMWNGNSNKQNVTMKLCIMKWSAIIYADWLIIMHEAQ